MRIYIFTLLLFWGIFATPVVAKEVRVAVAANFLETIHEIIANFEQDTGRTAVVSPGSTGQLYAQIKNGAPFDVFFSADVRRPKLIEDEGLAVRGSRFTYAVGRLTLWSPDPDMVKGDGKTVLTKGGFNHLAIANPKTAPYGTAAQKTLQALGLWDRMKDRIVQGENIGQTFQFVFSQNAQLGFVAMSQVLDPRMKKSGSRWDVPVNLYDKLRQQAVLLVHGEHNETAQAFLAYIRGAKAREIIERYGYGLE
jgi:molybdate transport system substrate-binding protein